MQIVNYQTYHTEDNGHIRTRALLFSDTLPDGFPASSDAIATAFPNHDFETLSVLYVIDPTETTHVYVKQESGAWIGTAGTISFFT